jgi:virginiamycin B lyase
MRNGWLHHTSYPVPASALAVPGLDTITVGPNGNMWFTETAVNRIGEITPRAAGPTIHEFALPAADRLAQGVGSSITSADTISAGPGNDIWFTEQGSNAIGVMSTSGALVSKFTVPNSNLSPTPYGITEGPDSTMWFTENADNQVASITAKGKIIGVRPTGRCLGASEHRLRARRQPLVHRQRQRVGALAST